MVFQVYRNMKHATISKLGNKSTSSSGVTRVFELLLQALTTMLAASIVGTGAHVYRTYRSQRAANNPIWLPLWPNHFDTTGIKVLIGTASAIVLLSVVYLAMAFIPKLSPSSQPKLSAMSLVGVSTLSVLLAIASIAVSALLEDRNDSSDTLRSWTCKFSEAETGAPIPSFMSNGNFHDLCRESRFAFYGMITVLTVQTILLGVGVSRWATSKKPQTPLMNDKSSDY